MDDRYEANLQLGRQVSAPESPEYAVIDCVPNPTRLRPPEVGSYLVRFTCPEFTSLCRVTGQPDFAVIVVDYVPDQLLIESKAFKLFMQSFRSHRAFHEQCAVTIADTLCVAARPRWLRVGAFFYPRGGIPIDVIVERGALPAGMAAPEPGVPPYRGR